MPLAPTPAYTTAYAGVRAIMGAAPGLGRLLTIVAS
jgi:hypothetical protein